MCKTVSNQALRSIQLHGNCGHCAQTKFPIVNGNDRQNQLLAPELHTLSQPIILSVAMLGLSTEGA